MEVKYLADNWTFSFENVNMTVKESDKLKITASLDMESWTQHDKFIHIQTTYLTKISAILKFLIF